MDERAKQINRVIYKLALVWGGNSGFSLVGLLEKLAQAQGTPYIAHRFENGRTASVDALQTPKDLALLHDDELLEGLLDVVIK